MKEEVKNPKISLGWALLPVIVLVTLLAHNVFVYGDNALSGSNQFILLVGAAAAAVVGFINKINYETMMNAVASNLASTSSAIIILLFVGALSGTWLISGIIPTMIYYGLQILNPTIFLVASVIIAALISIATGSSWTTSATVGIALIGIGKAIGLHEGIIAGAVISGAYFGDKLSPMSDTTNLAAAMAGTDLFTHIKYMTYTTVPSITIALIVFLIVGFTSDIEGQTDTYALQQSMANSFNITPWLLLVPLVVIVMIIFKTKPLIALFVGTLLGGAFAMFFQSNVINNNGLRYHVQVEKNVDSEFENKVLWSGSGNTFESAGEFSITGVDGVQSNLKIKLPSYSQEVETIEKSGPVFFEGEKIGEVSIIAKPTNFWQSSYFAVMDAITVDTSVETESAELNDLFSSGGMAGMLGTVWLIICAMVFGGIMESIGALARISEYFLSVAKGVFGLFAGTVATCLGVNLTASDQYLSIVVPGKMFKKAYEDKGLAPENLSRTLEDGGTVTSVLVPWNTCGAYQSKVLLGEAGATSYIPWAIFNMVSPFMTLLFAAFKIKIRMLKDKL